VELISLGFLPKKTINKERCLYKSLYIKECIANKVEKIAKKYNTSFNNVVISMIEYCLEEEKAKK
jgi:hypothetical protein